MTEVIESGWHPDPLGRHQQRYHDGTSWTEHVSDDAPPTEAVTSPGPAVAVPGLAAAVVLPDSPEQSRKRRLWGGGLVALAAGTVVAVALPWVSGSGLGATTFAGYETGGGAFVGAVAVGLGLYGAQALKRPRVRYHVAALLLVVAGLFGCFSMYAMLDDEQVLELAGEDPSIADTPDVQIGPIGIVTGSGEVERAREELQAEVGGQLAVVALFASLVPVIALWTEDRRRRREAGLLL